MSFRRISSPKIRELMELEIKKSAKKIVVVEGAGLIEANFQPCFDELWVCKLSKEEAFERVMKRNPDWGNE